LACALKFPSSIAQPHLAKIAKQTNKINVEERKQTRKSKNSCNGALGDDGTERERERERARLVAQTFIEI